MQEQNTQTDEPQGKDKPLEELLAEAQAKLEQQRDAMMRAVADAENARKRAQTEASAAQKYALERFAEQLLPVVDSLQAALASENTSREALRNGVELTLKQLGVALERHPELLQGQLDPVAQRLAAGVFAGERGLQAVDDRQELLGKALERILLRRRCLCLRALAGVFCVRHRAHHGVALLLQLGLCLGQQLLQRLVFALRLVRLGILLLHALELGMGREAFKPVLAIPAKLLSY